MPLTAEVSRSGPSGLSAGARPRRRHKSAPLLVTLFILSLAFPVFFNVGSITIFPYRAFLLIALFPAALLWIGGKAGRIRLPDILLICYLIWVSMTFVIAHGMIEVIEPAGSLVVDTLGAYFLARVYIRDASSFRAMARLLFIVVLVLAPFALVEAVTSRSIFHELLSSIGNVYPLYTGEPRMGLQRAQAAFMHPILYGVFCAGTLSLTFHVVMMNRAMLTRLISAGAVAFAAFFSLSTGAYVALWVQVALTGWDFVTRGMRRRWAILGGLAVAAYVIVSLFSNRTPFHVFVSYLTFNLKSSYNRILIWDFGTAEVMRNPLFGIGFSEWERPWWMSSSMDNFWLVIAVRHGLPALLLFMATILIVMYKIGRLKITDPEVAACRTGLLISLGGLIIAGITVHLWTQLYVYFIFLLGSGVWMLDNSRKTGFAPPLGRSNDTRRSRHLSGSTGSDMPRPNSP